MYLDTSPHTVKCWKIEGGVEICRKYSGDVLLYHHFGFQIDLRY